LDAGLGKILNPGELSDGPRGRLNH